MYFSYILRRGKFWVAGAVPPSATAGDGTALIGGWERRRTAYLEFKAHPLIAEVTGEGDREEERLWAIIYEVEDLLPRSIASTSQGIEVQPLMALYHSVRLTRCGENIVLRGDFAAVEQIENTLDWNARIIVAARQSGLRSAHLCLFTLIGLGLGVALPLAISAGNNLSSHRKLTAICN